MPSRIRAASSNQITPTNRSKGDHPMPRLAIPAALVLGLALSLPVAATAHDGHAHKAGEHHAHDGHDHGAGGDHSHDDHDHEAGEEHSHEGQNGGVVADAGKYHAELVVDGTPNVAVYLSGHDDSEVATTGFKGTAILLVEGKSQRFTLEPGEGSRLVGTAPVPVEKGVKGVVQLTGPDGKTAQAKF